MLYYFLLLTTNLLVIIISYFVIKHKVQKKVVNKDIIEKVKNEINGMIIQLNEATLNNVSLIEDKINQLNKLVIQADKKINHLKQTDHKKEHQPLLFNSNNFTYSPKKIVKETQKKTENLMNNQGNKTEKIEKELEKLDVNEKVHFLLGKGWNINDIQKKIGITSGELELLMNIENIRK